MSEPILGPTKTPGIIVAEITITVVDPQGWAAHEIVSVAVAPRFLHNLGGIAAGETERAVATLIRKLGDASGKRSRPEVVEVEDGG